MQRFVGIEKLPSRPRSASPLRHIIILAMGMALFVPHLSNAEPAACKLSRDVGAPLESQIDVLVATLDDCGDAHTLDDETVLKSKALLIKLRADIAEVRRRHRGDLLDGDRERFAYRLTNIVAQVPPR